MAWKEGLPFGANPVHFLSKLRPFPISVRRGADFRVPHEFLLHSRGRSYGIKSRAVGLPLQVEPDPATFTR
jgi:hypothetical protein